MVQAEQPVEQSGVETLRHHTSPHFLFNALNSVEALSRQAPGRIPELVRGLSRCLRYWLQPAHDGWVTLQQELDAVASYLEVEQVRRSKKGSGLICAKYPKGPFRPMSPAPFFACGPVGACTRRTTAC